MATDGHKAGLGVPQVPEAVAVAPGWRQRISPPRVQAAAGPEPKAQQRFRWAWAPFRQGRGLNVAFGSSTTLSCNRFCRSHGAKPVPIAFLSVATNRRRVPPAPDRGKREHQLPYEEQFASIIAIFAKKCACKFSFFTRFSRKVARGFDVSQKGKLADGCLKLPVRYPDSRSGPNLLPKSTPSRGESRSLAPAPYQNPRPTKPSLSIDAWHATSYQKSPAANGNRRTQSDSDKGGDANVSPHRLRATP